MRDTLFIITFGLMAYLGFSTLLGDTSLMGSFGVTFATFNHTYFGYISYIYIFISLVPIYIFYKDSTLTLRKFELFITSFLVLFSSLLAQAILVHDELRGTIGGDFVDFLSPYIGVFGLWIFWIIITLVSIVIILDKTTHEILELITKVFKETILSNSLLTSKENVVVEDNRTHIIHTQSEDEHVEPTSEPLEKLEDSFETEIDKPAYMRKGESIDESMDAPVLQNTKHNNILELVNDIKDHKNALIVDELEENTKLLETIEKGKVEKPKNFTLPSVDFLQKVQTKSHIVNELEVDEKIHFLIEKLAHFKIDGDVVRTYAGPVVSTF